MRIDAHRKKWHMARPIDRIQLSPGLRKIGKNQNFRHFMIEMQAIVRPWEKP